MSGDRDRRRFPRGGLPPLDAPFPRPRLVLSRCLELDACRYNGATVRTPLVRALEPHVELVPVCPELEIGLGVPRDPIRLLRAEGVTRLVQPASGRDLTDAMRSFAARFLDGLGDVDGFLLKARSPSCGPLDVKVFEGLHAEDAVSYGAGMFAAMVRERFPDLPVEHEVRLLERAALERFLTRLFSTARRREARERDAMVEETHAALRAYPPEIVERAGVGKR